MIELLNFYLLKILTVFSISPGSRFRRKLLKEKTGLSNIILDNNLNKLINLKILKIKKNLFYLNFENEEIKDITIRIYKEYNKLKQLPLKEYFIVLQIKENISTIKNIGDVYLFGSYAKLVFNKASDIDIAIISDNIKKENVNKAIKRLEKRHKKYIEVHFFTGEFYNNKRDPLVKEILQNGVKLI